MLQFLRKHQKIFFIFITAAVIVSFCFFGTYGSMAQQQAAPDTEVGRGVTGKPIMSQELAALTRLIEHSSYDRIAQEKGGLPNFLNDGVVEKDFFSTGLGLMLAREYFSELKGDFDERLKKIHAYRPYVHPSASYVSAENVWSRFSPDYLARYKRLKKESGTLSLEAIGLMSQLYVDQALLPPDTLKQLIYMQQNQFKAPQDPILVHSDLSLFGFKSMEEWFGPRYVSLVAQFIFNAAQVAEEKGYVVKTEEVRADLFQNIYQGYSQVTRNQELSVEDADHYYQMKMRGLGMDETMLIGAWRKVMLFRRLFEDGSGSVLLDPLAFRHFDKFAKESAEVVLYQLPADLQFSDFRSMIKFQLYLESVAADPSRLRGDLRMPSQLASLEQIERRAPELVERKVEVEYKAAQKEELCRAISVKETWEWETEDAHWDLLRKNFSELSALKAEDKQARLTQLSGLDPAVRTKVDQFARSKMIDAQPDKVRLALELAPVKSSTVSLKLKGSDLPFPGLEESSELVALLEHAALKSEAPNTASERLNFYTSDAKNYCSIQVISREPTKKVLTFAEAARNGTLEKLLDKRLEEAYPDVRKRDFHAFQSPQGGWKPFREVKDAVAKLYFSDLLKSVEDNYRDQFGMLPGKEGDLPLNFYSNARMLVWMKAAQQKIQANPEDASWLKSGAEADSLAAQWLLEKVEKRVERSSKVSFSKEEMFSLESNQWSTVKMGESGDLAFFFVKEKGNASLAPHESVEFGHQVLSFDARRDMMGELLARIHDKKGIDLSFVADRERE